MPIPEIGPGDPDDGRKQGAKREAQTAPAALLLFFICRRMEMVTFNDPKTKQEIMKKLLTLLAACCITLAAQAQYYYLPFNAAGTNPGGLNTDGEYPVGGGLPAGWTSIHPGSATTPAWTSVNTLPFTFQFNGSPVTQFKVSTSGVLTFATTATAVPAYTTVALPNAGIPDSSICILGIRGTGSNDNIVTKTFGTAPNRQHWVLFSSYSTASGAFTYWSIVLEETTNNIYVVDQRNSAAFNVSVGIQLNGTTAFMVAGSPALAASAGTDPTPADNSYYAFIYGTQAANQAKLRSVNLNQYVVIPGTSFISGEIQNLGANTIGAIDIKYEFAGSTYTFPVANLALASGLTASFTHPTPANVTSAQLYPVKVWVELAGDADHSDDTIATSISGLSYQTTKRVLIEEGTGTWCGWCPRGAVYTEQIDTVYPGTAIVVAVHNADPMTNTTYDAGMAALIAGYPSGAVDRKDIDVDPLDFENSYLSRINDVSPADIGVSAYFNAATRQVDIQVSATFATEVSGDFRLNAILVEDDVTGTTAGYNQTNYYSVQANNIALTGAGHNWQTEPNPVLAANMHYDFVARDILGGFDGQTGSLPGTCSAGSTYNYAFTTTLPATWDASQMRVIGVLQDATTGHILNVNRGPFGLTTAIETVAAPDFSMSLYPNPAVDFSQLEINMINSGNYAIDIFDRMGKSVYTQAFSGMSGKNILPISTRQLSSGMYMVRVIVNGQALTRRLVVK